MSLSGHQKWVSCLCMVDDTTLASGSFANTVMVWDLTAKLCKATLQGHTNSIKTLGRIDAKTLASGARDNDQDLGPSHRKLQI